jgi:transposase-like protein
VTDDDRKLREERQAAALREVADLGRRRADLLKQAEELLEPLQAAAVAAVNVGAPRRRTQELARVSTGVFYGWLQTAGIDVRAKRPARRNAP